MDSAYFVGRNEILTWINDRLHLNLSRVEEVNLVCMSPFSSSSSSLLYWFIQTDLQKFQYCDEIGDYYYYKLLMYWWLFWVFKGCNARWFTVGVRKSVTCFVSNSSLVFVPISNYCLIFFLLGCFWCCAMSDAWYDLSRSCANAQGDSTFICFIFLLGSF